ncbi:spindle assembly [Mactra antiquata]
MSCEEDLATVLHTWAVKEMRFYSQGLTSHSKIPSVNDFKIMCKGPNAAIWKWVTSHVRSTETVKTVRGNLALKRKTSQQPYTVNYGESKDQYDDTKSSLISKKSSLLGEITTTLRDIGHLEYEVERITKEISETDHNYEREKENVNNTRRKAALLQSYCMKCKDTMAQYSEYSKCITCRVENIKQRAQKSYEAEEFYSRETDDNNDDVDTSPLETASAKHVRQCCDDIGLFLHDTLRGEFAGDKTQFSRRKEPLWQKAEQVSNDVCPDQILTSLITNTRHTSAQLKTMTSRVDIRRDAQNLRFKYESNGSVQDLSNPPSLLRSVHQLLQERSTEHFGRFVLTQKYTNEARNLEEAVVALKSQIEKQLQKMFSNKTADYQMARKLIDLELELDGCRASLHCLNKEAESLKEVVENSYRERQELFAKYHKIQEFQDLTDKKQNVIQVLVKQNINSQSRLDAQIDEINSYIEKSLKSNQSQIGDVADKLKNCVIVEANEFANLSLQYLMFSQIDNALKTAVIDLSIHQTDPSLLRPALINVLECIKFPTFQAPEMILKQCIEMKSGIEDNVPRLDWEALQQKWKQSKNYEGDIVSEISGLCEEMKTEDKQQINKCLPLLQQRITMTASAISNCLRAKDAAQVWWNQPGQNCVPWVTVDGHNLQHYMDQWTVLVTNLRQMLLK